jgi:hypothetical protein
VSRKTGLKPLIDITTQERSSGEGNIKTLIDWSFLKLKGKYRRKDFCLQMFSV